MHSDQGEHHIGPAASSRLLPRLHSAGNVIETSHHGLRVGVEGIFWPQLLVDPPECTPQADDAPLNIFNARFDLQDT